PDAYLPALATSLQNLAISLGDVGRMTDGVAAIEEAVRYLRALTEINPEIHLPALAMALNYLAISLGDVGRTAEGLVVIEEVVRIGRAPAQADPEHFHAILRQSRRILAWLESLPD
ncbi:hypothetical protein ABT160_25990, partial [Streptomyces sp. NPDC001941]